MGMPAIISKDGEDDGGLPLSPTSSPRPSTFFIFDRMRGSLGAEGLDRNLGDQGCQLSPREQRNSLDWRDIGVYGGKQ